MGRRGTRGHEPPYIWPTAEDEGGPTSGSSGRRVVGGARGPVSDLERVSTSWRIADEHGHGHHERSVPTVAGTPAAKQADTAERSIRQRSGGCATHWLR